MMPDAFLNVRNVSYTFSNGTEPLAVLDSVSFSVAEGQFVCLLGPSGSGKSTLLRLLAGLLEAQQGEVAVSDQAVAGPREGVGMVFQNANLMPWRTVAENIRLPLEVADGRTAITGEAVAAVTALVGLGETEHMLPGELSGGMAQRVALARAFVQNPELLLLDEPFGALDAITRERMGAELLRMWQAHQKTVVMVTHDISEAIFLADRVLVLSERPAHIRLDLKIELPRPREEELRYSAAFNAYARQLRAAIR
jgi:NitT/TauT family transport system ATP-binding protein